MINSGITVRSLRKEPLDWGQGSPPWFNFDFYIVSSFPLFKLLGENRNYNKSSMKIEIILIGCGLVAVSQAGNGAVIIGIGSFI